MKAIARVIVCYNNSIQLGQMIETLHSEKNTIVYNFIDNTNQRFPSAASAYNHAIQEQIPSDVIIFCHQDIRFSRDSIDIIVDACLKDKNTLFGTAGVKNEGRLNWGGIISTLDGAKMNWSSNDENNTVSVFVLDECIIAGHVSLFNKVSFDEDVCYNWHLYSADLCLQCHAVGAPVKIIDMKVKHLSPGHVNWAFIKTEGRLAHKYRKNYKIISHTNGWTYTGFLKRHLQLMYRFIKYRWWNLK